MTRLIAALQDKTLSDDSPSSSFWKCATLGPAPVDELSWTTAKSVCSSLWSSKTDTENWTSFTTGNGRRLFTFQTKLHKTYWITLVRNYFLIAYRILSRNLKLTQISIICHLTWTHTTLIKNAHFLKTTLCTSVLKNSHNFACGQYFFRETCIIVFSWQRAIKAC